MTNEIPSIGGGQRASGNPGEGFEASKKNAMSHDVQCLGEVQIPCSFMSKEAMDFADTTMTFLDEGLKREDDLIGFYDALDSKLDTCIEDLTAAHLMSYVWCVMSVIHFPDMNISADDAAEMLKKDLIEATRLSLARIYEVDVNA